MFFHYATRKISPICKISTFSEYLSFLNPNSRFKTNFAVKPAERSNHLFLLSIWWIIFLKHLHTLISHNRIYIELNWLCKHTKKVRSSQGIILVMNWVKHSFSLWVSFKELTGNHFCVRTKIGENITNILNYYVSN